MTNKTTILSSASLTRALRGFIPASTLFFFFLLGHGMWISIYLMVNRVTKSIMEVIFKYTIIPNIGRLYNIGIRGITAAYDRTDKALNIYITISPLVASTHGLCGFLPIYAWGRYKFKCRITIKKSIRLCLPTEIHIELENLDFLDPLKHWKSLGICGWMIELTWTAYSMFIIWLVKRLNILRWIRSVLKYIIINWSH